MIIVFLIVYQRKYVVMELNLLGIEPHYVFRYMQLSLLPNASMNNTATNIYSIFSAFTNTKLEILKIIWVNQNLLRKR